MKRTTTRTKSRAKVTKATKKPLGRKDMKSVRGGNRSVASSEQVVVKFAEGDPDQPVIIGSVYNAAQTPPYSLPAPKLRPGRS